MNSSPEGPVSRAAESAFVCVESWTRRHNCEPMTPMFALTSSCASCGRKIVRSYGSSWWRLKATAPRSSANSAVKNVGAEGKQSQ